MFNMKSMMFRNVNEALRVSRAVTRLTVYRPLEVMIAQDLTITFGKLRFFYFDMMIADRLI